MIYSLEEFEKFDKMKSKVLKYVIYKKRTEQEIRQKFAKEFDENILDNIIEELKENKYIDDFKYIERAVNEFMNLKNLSLKQVRYKLFSKGIKNNLIDEYFSNNIDELEEYERKSIYKIICKKRSIMEDEDIRLYLLKKGYKEENIKNGLAN